MKHATNPEETRKPEHPIESIFIRRWSPRAMSGEPITEAEMLTFFEAARWAPSTYNEQEWRFLYARRDTPPWAVFFDLLAEGNRVWCQRAALLSVIVAHKVFGTNGKPNQVHLFDSGLAFENLWDWWFTACKDSILRRRGRLCLCRRIMRWQLCLRSGDQAIPPNLRQSCVSASSPRYESRLGTVKEGLSLAEQNHKQRVGVGLLARR